MNGLALNQIGSKEGEAEAEAGQYWLFEYEGVVYCIPIWEELILVNPNLVGHA